MRLQANQFTWHKKHTYRRPNGKGLQQSILKIGKALEACTCEHKRAKLQGLLERQILKAQLAY